MVESRFGHEPKAIDDLTRFLASHPSPDRQRNAYEELAVALVREGRYGEGARNLTEALRLTPAGEQTDKANTHGLYAALANIPPQSVAFGDDVPDVSRRARFNELGAWDVPVDVNGRRGEWIFDTGANFSTLSAGEAERLGLETFESDTYVRGSTGKMGGAGEVIVRKTEVVRTRRLFVSGRPMDLSNVSLLTIAPEGDGRYRDRVLGMDALGNGFTLDFRAMQLRLE
jgi:predicted aspartyl protease